MALLIAEDGPTAGQRYLLDCLKYVVGRHPECDIVVNAGAVSRYHAQLVLEGDAYFLEDLSSRNGTFVNGQPVLGRHRLADGDRIRICDALFAFHQTADESTATAVHARDSSGTDRVVVVDDPRDSSFSSIVSKLDVSSEDGSVRISASADTKLKALLEIARSLGGSLSLDQVLAQILNSLFKIFVHADRGFIVLRDERGRLIPRWIKHRQDSMVDTIRISRTIISHVIETKQAVLSDDAAADSRWKTSESIADFRIRSMICAPLIDTEGAVIGALQIDTADQRNRFRPEDLEVLAGVAMQAAVAIDNAQLHEAAISQRELQRDLELARKVQRGFLPRRTPQLEGYEFFHHYQPASHVGGDYFDYIPLPDGRLAVAIADVVGHGVAAALLMSKLSAAVRFSLATAGQPASAVLQLNRRLLDDQLDDRFVTLVLTVLDPVRHELVFVNAGHPPLLLVRADGRVEKPGEDLAGFPLLAVEDAQYRQANVRLEPDDMLVLHTDGLTECVGPDGSLFGLDRLTRLLRPDGAQELGHRILDSVAQFVGQQPPGDDMCLVCCRRCGVPGNGSAADLVGMAVRS